MTDSVYECEQNGLWFRCAPKDCTRFIAGFIQPGSVDVIVTSPPYKRSDGFSLFLMHGLAMAANTCLKKTGLIFLNMGQLLEEPERPFKSMLAFAEEGFKLRQTVIWAKARVVETPVLDDCGNVVYENNEVKTRNVQRGHIKPINSKMVMNYCHEYIFVLERKDVKHRRNLERLSIPIEFADLSNLGRGGRGKNGNARCGGDIWFIPYETTGQSKSKMHRYEYPLELPRRCILLSGTKKGGTVWDPFTGGGSTAVAAKSLGIHYVGHDLDASCCETSLERWKSYSP